MEKLKNMKGITLIALVITIVVLLILAGVTIAMLTGDNGILTKATTAKTKSAEEEAREKVNLMLAGWKMKNATDSSITLDAYIADEQEIQSYGVDSVTGSAEDGYTAVVEVRNQNYYVDIIINENGNAEIINIAISNIRPTIEFALNSEGYMFEGDSSLVEITVKATAPEGETITKIEPVGENQATLKEGNTYTVTKNGTYRFKVTTSGNKTNTASKTINNILQAPEISVVNVTTDSLTINVLTIYTDDASVKYEYYVDGIKKCDQTSERVYNAYGLNSDITHNIKVRAYITDGSYKDTEKIVDSYINFSNPTNLTGKEIDESKIEYIYNNGIVNEDFGGVEVIGNSEGNSIAEFKSNYIFCATSTRCARYNAKIGTKNTIDLSEYESINAVVNCISYKEGNFGMGLFSAEAVDTYINHKKVNSYSSFESNKPFIISCDINQTGRGYAGISYTYDKFFVSQIYLIRK